MDYMIFDKNKDYSAQCAAFLHRTHPSIFIGSTIPDLHAILRQQRVRCIFVNTLHSPMNISQIHEHIYKFNALIPICLYATEGDNSYNPTHSPSSLHDMWMKDNQEILEQLYQKDELNRTRYDFLFKTASAFFSRTADKRLFHIPHITIDYEKQQLIKKGTAHTLTAMPWKLIELFTAKPNTPHSLESITQELWANTKKDKKACIYAYIHLLRSILEEDPHEPSVLIRDKKGYYKLIIDIPPI